MKIDLKMIIEDLKNSKWTPDYIVGIARGGLIPATYLSHALDTPLLTFRYSLRDHAYQDRFDYIAKQLREGKKLLFVDDICDEGETMKQIWDVLRAKTDDSKFEWTYIKSAVLINNLGQETFKPDFVGTQINKAKEDVWIVFPWEDLD